MNTMIAQFPKQKINYWRVPKCASVSILTFLMIKEGLVSADEAQELTCKNVDPLFSRCLEEGIFVDRNTALKRNFQNFSIVRHPVHRFVSGFQYFVYKRSNSFFKDKNVFLNRVMQKVRQTKSMETLIDGIVSADIDQLDRHFRPQSDILKDIDQLSCLKQECLPSCLLHVVDDIEGFPYINSSGSSVDNVSFELREKVESFYARDLNLWKNSMGPYNVS